jgi:hypothetical protein
LEQASTTRIHAAVFKRAARFEAEFQNDRIAARDYDLNRPEPPISGVTSFDTFIPRRHIVKREATERISVTIARGQQQMDPTASNRLPCAVVDHNARYNGTIRRSAPWLHLELSLGSGRQRNPSEN